MRARSITGMLTAFLLIVSVSILSVSGRGAAVPATPVATPGVSFSVADLGTLGGRTSAALDVNDEGVAVGWATSPPSDGEVIHAVRWEGGQTIDLGTLGGLQSWATGINNGGTIVGLSVTANDERHACVWKANGEIADLGTLGGNESAAWAVNDRGVVVGMAAVPSGTLHAAAWEDGSVTDLGALVQDGASSANAINESGVIAGTAFGDWGGDDFAVVWRDGTPARLETPAGGTSSVTGINDRGRIVGFGEIDASGQQTVEVGYVWDDERVVTLSLFGGGSTHPQAVNARGQIVGDASLVLGDTTEEAPRLAFLWDDGEVTDLGAVVGGGKNSAAYAINASGAAVGYAEADGTERYAVLWTPGMPQPVEAAASPTTEPVSPTLVGTTRGPIAIDLTDAGTLYAGSGHGMLYAIDEETGGERWRAEAPAAHVSADGVVDGVVLASSFDLPTFGNAFPGSALLGLDAETGRLRWSIARDDLATVVGVAGHRVFALTVTALVPPGTTPEAEDAMRLAAIEADSGAVLWQRSGVFDAWVDAQDATTVYAVVFGSGNTYDLAALNAEDGTERWRAPIGSLMGFWIEAADAKRLYVTAFPAASTGAVMDATFWAVDRDTGKILWQVPLGVFSSPGLVVAPESGVVVAAMYNSSEHESALYGIDIVTGVIRWRTSLPGWLHHGPILAGGTVVIGNQEDDLFGVRTASAFGVDPATGRFRWRISLPETWAGAKAATDGTVFVVAGGHDRDYQRLLALDSETGERRWSLAITGTGEVQAVSDGRVYINGTVFDAADTEGSGRDGLLAIDVKTGRIVWRIASDEQSS